MGNNQTNNLKKTIIKSVFALLVATGCQSQMGDTSAQSSVSSETTEESGAALSDVEVRGLDEIVFDDSNVASVTVSEIVAEDQYVVALYTGNAQETSSFDYSLAGLEDRSVETEKHVSVVDEDNTEDFHNALRVSEEGIDGNVASVSREASATVGSTRSFKVLNSFSSSTSYDTISATLRYATDHVYAYVDTRNANALSDDQLAEVIGNYEAVYADQVALFGEPSDVNGDGHIAVLFTQSVNEIGASGGGFVSGYFYAADLYSASSVSVSNEMEVIYSVVPDAEGEFGVSLSSNFALSNIITSVIPHEVQHLISYNNHVILNHGSPEVSFLNEGLSHLAEDIYSINGDGYMTQTGIDNPSRVDLYLNHTSDVSFSAGSNITQRGGSYLFLRYWYEQAQKGNINGVENGAALINSLVNTNLTGTSNLVSQILGSDDTDDFIQLMGSFTAAVYLSNTGATEDDRFNFDGINLHATQDDNRGTVLAGPVTSSNGEGSLTASSMTYLVLTGEDIENMGGILSITAGSNAQVGGWLIHLQ